MCVWGGGGEAMSEKDGLIDRENEGEREREREREKG